MPTVTLRPGAAGFHAEQSSGTWEDVDEETADDDTSFIASTIQTGATETRRTSLKVGGQSNLTPTTVTVKATARRASAKSCRISLGLSTPGGSVSEPSVSTLTDSYAEYSQAFTTNPFTGEAWAQGDFDNIEAVALARNHTLEADAVTVRITQLWVELEYDQPTYAQRHTAGATVAP